MPESVPSTHSLFSITIEGYLRPVAAKGATSAIGPKTIAKHCKSLFAATFVPGVVSKPNCKVWFIELRSGVHGMIYAPIIPCLTNKRTSCSPASLALSIGKARDTKVNFLVVLCDRGHRGFPRAAH